MIAIMENFSFYWFFYGVIMLVPQFVCSFMLPARNCPLFRRITGVIVFTVIAAITSGITISIAIPMIVLHAASISYLIWCNKLRFGMYVYYNVWCITLYYLMQQLSTWFVRICGTDDSNNLIYLGKIISLILIVPLEIWIIRSIQNKGAESFKGEQILLAVLISVSVVGINTIGFHTSSQQSSVPGFSMLLVVLALYIQVVSACNNKQRNDAEFFRFLWNTTKKDYEMKKEYIDLINQKYHDLKHELRALKQISPEEREERLDKLEKAIDQYQNLYHTGNEALDTILNDKRRECDNCNILLTCIAQPGELEFIDLVDLNILLGNLIDNAIEAVFNLSEEQRMIDLKILNDDHFLRITETNFYSGELKYVSDELLSTKSQEGYHGFGTKSMRYIVKKYHGEMVIDPQFPLFRLYIVIPVSENTDNK